MSTLRTLRGARAWRVRPQTLPYVKAAWPRYSSVKRAVDVAGAALLMPVFVGAALILLPLNALFNPGPLLFTQRRMGQHYREFTIIKFRSMLPSSVACRGPEDPLETNRITRLGALLRRTRVDELPQLINVLRGDMSLIGPRPDAVEHAQQFSTTVTNYADRYAAKPGITGLAQVSSGYAEGAQATRRKLRYDRIYLQHSGARLDLFIFVKTLRVVLTGFGAR